MLASRFFPSGFFPDQAGCATGRGPGASTIGRLISADSTPNKTESHQIGVNEPNFSNTIPPNSTPRNPPALWPKNSKPETLARQRGPNIRATRLDVGGTVGSQTEPEASP